ncbi:hypothetical protein NQZ68_024943 [Dissostichus eleginoides]|nr:hypothetical protein NQZ68_024943 [Dissostichus eleginoides]
MTGGSRPPQQQNQDRWKAGPSRGKSSSAQQHTPGGSRPQPEAWSHSVSPRRLWGKILLSTAVLYRWEQASADRRSQTPDTRQVESRQQQVEPLRLFATSPGKNHNDKC